MASALNDIRQQLRNAAHTAGLPRFWRWWMGELAALLPARSRNAIKRRFARPVVEFTADEVVFWRPEFNNGAARLVEIDRVALTGDQASVRIAARAAMNRIGSSANTPAPRVCVALPARWMLRKQFNLPAAVEENLTQTLAYDLDRHTPFRADQLYFDAAIIGRDAVKKTIQVDWMAALRNVVDDARRRVEDWGGVPVAVTSAPPSSAPPRLNLIPEQARQKPMPWRRWEVWGPAATVGVLALATVLVPLAQKREYAIELNQQAEVALQQAESANALRAQLERLQDDYNHVLAKKYAYPSSVQVLDDVSRVLPDDTWITQFEVKTSARGKDSQREMFLRGESANAGKLISLLEDSKLVEQAALRSPTTKIQPGPGEVFDLGARLRTLPPPQLVSVKALAVIPASVQNAAAAPPGTVPPAAPASAAASGPAPIAPGGAVPPPRSSPSSNVQPAGNLPAAINAAPRPSAPAPSNPPRPQLPSRGATGEVPVAAPPPPEAPTGLFTNTDPANEE